MPCGRSAGSCRAARRPRPADGLGQDREDALVIPGAGTTPGTTPGARRGARRACTARSFLCQADSFFWVDVVSSRRRRRVHGPSATRAHAGSTVDGTNANTRQGPSPGPRVAKASLTKGRETSQAYVVHHDDVYRVGQILHRAGLLQRPGPSGPVLVPGRRSGPRAKQGAISRSGAPRRVSLAAKDRTAKTMRRNQRTEYGDEQANGDGCCG